MTAKHPNLEAFNRTVWSIVRQVPQGQVTTYGQIASMIPAPDGVDLAEYARLSPRWVGQAMNMVSAADSGNIPWWRVINAKGGISLAADSRAGQQQRQRLRREGVTFNDKESVDFAVVGWHGPSDEWREAHGLLAPRPLIPPPDEDHPTQLTLF